jgi:hypothetical protein
MGSVASGAKRPVRSWPVMAVPVGLRPAPSCRPPQVSISVSRGPVFEIFLIICKGYANAANGQSETSVTIRTPGPSPPAGQPLCHSPKRNHICFRHLEMLRNDAGRNKVRPSLQQDSTLRHSCRRPVVSRDSTLHVGQTELPGLLIG